MNTRRLRLVRPKWTLGTIFLIVGWSAVVVWLNLRPKVVTTVFFANETTYVVSYGYPCDYAIGQSSSNPHPSVRQEDVFTYEGLAANIAIGLLAVAVLTFASKYLVRAIVAGLRAFRSKPPPDNEKGP